MGWEKVTWRVFVTFWNFRLWCKSASSRTTWNEAFVRHPTWSLYCNDHVHKIQAKDYIMNPKVYSCPVVHTSRPSPVPWLSFKIQDGRVLIVRISTVLDTALIKYIMFNTCRWWVIPESSMLYSKPPGLEFQFECEGILHIGGMDIAFSNQCITWSVSRYSLHGCQARPFKRPASLCTTAPPFLLSLLPYPF